MTGIQNGKTRNLEKPFPGCLGKMVNLFDLSAGMPGNRLLTEKPYGSPLSRSCSDVSRLSPIRDLVEDKVISSESRRTSLSKRSISKPIKMLMAEQMTKEVVSSGNSPNVVARLMGLDAIPRQMPHSASQRSHGRSYSQFDVPLDYWQQRHQQLETEDRLEIRQHPELNDFKDVHEIWQSHNACVKDNSSQRERFGGSESDKKMALVREKFTDLKRLGTDEKLRQSKKYQDALEVLSSNKDLFLKFLQEPNYMFSQHPYDLQSILPPSDTKRITVLRPAKKVDSEIISGSQKQFPIKKTSTTEQANRDKRSGFSTPTNCKFEDTRIQTTRIVVLKPSQGKSHDIKTVLLPCSSLPSSVSIEDNQGDFEENNERESREDAKEIARQMHENLAASVFSNGYFGDESSFHKSENEFAVENFSYSEPMSPTSRHSWDYINQTDSPYSLSSFSRASYSPESSVCREAKKRLSERWSMMSSNGSCQEKRHMQRGSSTLGEMLAVPDMNKFPRPEEDSSHGQEARESTSSLITISNGKDNYDATPRDFSRSKSIPASSTSYGTRPELEVSHPKMEKTEITEVTKAKSVKSSLKGRVSSLFFSRNKRSSKHVSSQSDTATDSGLPTYADPSEHDSDIVPSNKASSSDLFSNEPKSTPSPAKAGFSVSKSFKNESCSENQEQPSPISVLEPLFDEDDHSIPEFYNNLKPDENGTELSSHITKLNLIDKSPPIGSVARTLSWDDSCIETANPYSLKSTMLPIGTEEEKQECFFLVQTLLSAAGLNNEVQSDQLIPRLYSLDSPLDPSLRENYIGLNNWESLHEVEQRQRRSTQKLVFDCVNTVLMDLAGCGSATCQRGMLHSVSPCKIQDHASSTTTTIVDGVWNQIKEWFCGEVMCVFGDFGYNSLVMGRVVSKEVVGKVWVQHLTIEIEDIQKEIEKNLLEELVQEAVEEFTGGL
ncbi:putative Methyl-coenzyme M reductase II subunit gamma [Heracleum sosnowskyi]|uniref:Methyl-coenzyme M reductase II subunit gamma n=1 Tax=Heracleum sosnowskyi TaxID=360622 RepID=A0AAD8J634_9APIA|nr:putative Methyl-coenzyme M reductase II subunit gamma [Heracleum sosnowskyi]